MDACYGAFALNRGLKPGSMRFLKDMLLRHARQVLTAGFANETVADLGGLLPGPVPSTGHLLEAFWSKAADVAGVITANVVMAHVYQSVGRDSGSHQTPHYGYVDGDGDLIFAAPILSPTGQATEAVAQGDHDMLVAVPVVTAPSQHTMANDSVIERTKE